MTSKADIIEERKANLPLPDDPPTASDWNSADARNVNVESSGQAEQASRDIANAEGSDPSRGPATGDSAVRVSGEDWKTNVEGTNAGRTEKEGLSGLPNDAVTRGAKTKAGLVDTTKPDYGYPAKNDPSSGVK